MRHVTSRGGDYAQVLVNPLRPRTLDGRRRCSGARRISEGGSTNFGGARSVHGLDGILKVRARGVVHGARPTLALGVPLKIEGHKVVARGRGGANSLHASFGKGVQLLDGGLRLVDGEVCRGVGG